MTWVFASALGRIRTCDARFRKPTLYPLSYEGWSPEMWQMWEVMSSGLG